MVSTDGPSVVEEQAVATPPATQPTPPATKSRRQKKQPPRSGRRRKIDPALIEFQPDAVEIEERPIPGKARWTLYTIILIIISVVLWAWLTEVDRIVVAEGELITSISPIVVQSATTNEVQEIRAKFGQIVVAGEVLAVLDGDIPDIDVERLEKDIAARNATIARLQAERNHTPFVVDTEDPKNLAMLDELGLYRSRQDERNAKIQELTQTIKKFEAEIRTNETNYNNNSEKLVVMVEIENVIAGLLERGVESEFEFLSAKLRRLEAEGKVRDLEAKKEELQEQLAQAKKSLDGYLANWDAVVGDNLVKAQNELKLVQSDLARAEKAQTFVNLTVPSEPAGQSYMVVEATDRASVAEGAKPLFKLVPMGVPLEAEIEIPAKDIGLIALDDDVRIKLNAFPYQKHGTLTGTVRAISEGAFQEGQGPMQNSFFLSTVSLLDGQRLENVQPDMRLMPGMSATCEIRVGKRRVLEYFLYPLFRQLDESIREP
jgi:hemolysin D